VKRREVFASLVAQHQNLGDVALRKQMVSVTQCLGRLNLLAPNCPSDYLESLDLPWDCLLITSRMKWSGRLIYQSLRGASTLVYSPGPQLLEDRPRVIASELMRIAVTSLLRLLGTKVIRLGRSFESDGPVMLALVRLHTRLLTLAINRDSRLDLGLGNCYVLPDLVLGGGDCEPSFSGKHLAVSLRYDRQVDIELFARELRLFARRVNLAPVVVSQVTFDVPRNQELADRLGVRHVGATGAVRHRMDAVSDVYRDSQVVLSDRLHALIMGLTHGAVPWMLDTGHPHKLQRALHEIGLDVSIYLPSTVGSAEIPAGYGRLEAEQSMSKARVRLGQLDEILRQSVGLERR
jgi:hypothetical protein